VRLFTASALLFVLSSFCALALFAGPLILLRVIQAQSPGR
jgi:hypothetical protein